MTKVLITWVPGDRWEVEVRVGRKSPNGSGSFPADPTYVLCEDNPTVEVTLGPGNYVMVEEGAT